MKGFQKQINLTFHIYDESQNVAKEFGAVCTPDFFGYNHHGKLNYRGRIELNRLTIISEKMITRCYGTDF